MTSKRSIICAIILLLQTVQPHNEKPTVSVIIPCVPQHLIYVYSLLMHYTRQTQLPYEIVIALSEDSKKNKNLIKIIKKQRWPFKVKIKATSKKQYAGQNRNRGAKVARGDVLIFQDADDVPHPQLVEIVRHFFATKPIVHLLYMWIPHAQWLSLADGPTDFASYTINNIASEQLTDPEQLTRLRLTNGQPCVLRSILNTTPWPETINTGEDIRFNSSIISAFPGQSVAINAHLSIYYGQRSSYR